ncbi:MAG: hypothetical protein ACRDP6_14795 [Actinoallomurus sp.]
MADGVAPTKTRPGDQQLPSGGRECVQDALIALIEERKQLGIQRYGSPLMTHNGRDSVRDATEEALDLTVYLMQVAMEMRDLRAELEQAREERDAARLVSQGRTMEHYDAEATIGRVEALAERWERGLWAERYAARELRTALTSSGTESTPQVGAVYDCTDKSWPPSEAFLRAYSAWLAAHGIDSNETRRIEHHDQPTIAQPFIRVHQRDMFSGVDREPLKVAITTPPPSPEDYA